MKILTDWLETTTNEQRKIFVDTLFELFYSTDANTFGEISTNWKENVPKILKKYRETSVEDKKIMTKMVKIIVSSYMNTIKQQERVRFDNMKEEYIIKSKTKAEELDKKYLYRFKKNAEN